MLFVKHKKTIIGLAVAGFMTLGGASAFAATSGPMLTPGAHLDISKVNVQKGEIKAAGEIDPKILDSFKNAKTAPGK